MYDWRLILLSEFVLSSLFVFIFSIFFLSYRTDILQLMHATKYYSILSIERLEWQINQAYYGYPYQYTSTHNDERANHHEHGIQLDLKKDTLQYTSRFCYLNQSHGSHLPKTWYLITDNQSKVPFPLDSGNHTNRLDKCLPNNSKAF